MSASNDNISFTVSKKHIQTLSTTIKTLALTGGLYAFAFQMVPAVVSSEPAFMQSGGTFDASFDDTQWVSGDTNYWADHNATGSVGYGDFCTSEDCAFSDSLDKTQVESRVKALFPDFGNSYTIRQLGSGNLYEVYADDVQTTFVISADGNYLINSSYFDLSNVSSSSDVDKLIEVNLQDNTQMSNSAPAQASMPGASDDFDSDLFRQEAFNWAVENASIKYPAMTDEVKGDIVVFADYTCPQCRAFHNDYNIVRSNGYNLHIALLSGSGNSGRVFDVTNNVLCSADPKSHYEEAIQAGRSYHGRVEDVDRACTSPAGDFREMAMHFMLKEMDRPGTPGIWVNGEYFTDRHSALRL